MPLTVPVKVATPAIGNLDCSLNELIRGKLINYPLSSMVNGADINLSDWESCSSRFIYLCFGLLNKFCKLSSRSSFLRESLISGHLTFGITENGAKLWLAIVLTPLVEENASLPTFVVKLKFGLVLVSFI